MNPRIIFLAILLLPIFIFDTRLGSVLDDSLLNADISRKDQRDILDALLWLRNNISSSKTVGLSDDRRLSIAQIYGLNVKPTVSYPDYIITLKPPIRGFNQTQFFLMMGYDFIYTNDTIAVLKERG